MPVTYLTHDQKVITLPDDAPRPKGAIRMAYIAENRLDNSDQKWPLLEVPKDDRRMSRYITDDPGDRYAFWDGDKTVSPFFSSNGFVSNRLHGQSDDFRKSLVKTASFPSQIDYVDPQQKIVKAPRNQTSGLLTPLTDYMVGDRFENVKDVGNEHFNVPTDEESLAQFARSATGNESFRDAAGIPEPDLFKPQPGAEDPMYQYAVPERPEPATRGIEPRDAVVEEAKKVLPEPRPVSMRYEHPLGIANRAATPIDQSDLPVFARKDLPFEFRARPAPAEVNAAPRVAAPAPAAPAASRPATAAPARQAPTAARPAAAAPAPSGFMSSLFRDPYAGMTSQQLFQRHEAMGGSPGATQLYMRAAAKQAEEARAARTIADEVNKKKQEEVPLPPERPSEFPREPAEEQKAHGGAAVGGKKKDAALIKALEIIHHMLRGR